MSRKLTLKTLAAAGMMLVWPTEALVSGATEETLETPYFSLTLATPRISFMVDPATGESGERAFHAEAKERFGRLLAGWQSPLTTALDTLFERRPELGRILIDPELKILSEWNRDELKGVPCCMSFVVDEPEMGSLNLCFSAPLTVAQAEGLSNDLRTVFKGLPAPP